MDRNRKAFERMMGRNFGMSEATKEKLAKQNAQFNDWYGVCRKCGQSLTGSLEELRKGHSCGKEG
jgi:hypothetical protein